MIQINPYRRNCEVIKNFFGKPIILIIAIALCLSSVASIATDLLITRKFFQIPLIEILYTIGFFGFYIKGRKKSEATSFCMPINTITTASIISIVVNALAFIGWAVIFFISNSGISIDLPFYAEAHFLTLTYYLPIYAMQFISAIVMLVLLSSVKKSTNSIYLYKKGSLSFAIVSFAFALIRIGYVVYNGLSLASINSISIIVVLILLGAFAIMYNRYITNVSSSISVPKPVAETIDTAPQPTPVVQPVQNAPVQTNAVFVDEPKHTKHSKSSKNTDYNSSLVNMWDTSDPSIEQNSPESKDFTSQTLAFDPQPVFAQPTPDYSYPDSPILAQDNPVPVQNVNNTAQAVQQEQPVLVQRNVTPIAPVQPPQPTPASTPAPAEQKEEIVEEKPFSFCTFCGKKCPPENHYCGACGNKLTK